MARIPRVAGFAFAAWAALAQSPPAFEVASVKPSGPRSMRNFERGAARLSYTGTTLHDLLYEAWDLVDFQQISGPSWLTSESYDIVATYPPGTARGQQRLMLQNLLAERFALRLHHETRDFPVYDLVPSKGRTKLTSGAAFRLDKPGFPELPGDRPTMASRFDEKGICRLAARRQPLTALAHTLRHSAGRLVLDKTGLDGLYTFTLEFKLDESTDDDSAPDLFSALQQQLSLRLEPAAPFDVLVIDHAKKVPVEN